MLAFCHYVRKTLGETGFSFYDGKWRFTNMKAVEIIKGRYPATEIDPVIQMKYEMYLADQERELLAVMESERLKKAVDSNVEIKNISGNLYPYQKIGVEFFLNNKGRAILADDMGLGKSLQALAYVATAGMNKTLVICPASVKYSWEEETKKWTALRPLVIESQLSLSIEDYGNNDIFIINYDIVKKFLPSLLALPWDCLIADEFHYIKNNAAQRTKAVMMIARKTKNLLLLSGTPMLSRPVELYNGLNLLDPHTWSNYYTYTRKYCGGHEGFFGYDARGATNLNELQSRIGRYFLRRTKDQVLKELPPKQFIDIPVDLPAATRKEYDLAVDDFQDYLVKVKRKTDKEVIRSLAAEKLVRLAALRQITTKGKISHAWNTIQDIIESGQKVVVFSVYNEPLEQLRDKLGKSAVMLTGSVDSEKRKELIDRFQNDPETKVFLGGTKSAGVGITLTSAANVLFIDYSWVPADHAQAADRIHRIGQKASTISIYQLYSRNTIDDYMRKLLANKKEIFDKVIGEQEEHRRENSFTNDLIKMLEKE